MAGSLQAEALAHPLVKRALELFNGEVRSVLDLREKKNADNNSLEGKGGGDGYESS